MADEENQFINHIIAPDAERAEVGHKTKSCTSDVNSLPFSIDGFSGSIIDTPGFDDTYLSDAEVLQKIANWMEFT
jgi:putative ribosome biogenesis GTPase RsgA